MRKTCNTCQQPKAAKHFFKQAMARDGLQGSCKQCVADKRKTDSAHLKQERGLSYHQGFRWRLRYEALLHYSPNGAVKCACCGETHLEFLAIDHINGGGNTHRKEVGLDIYGWLRREGFPEGFRVLCHNCNQSIGMYGYCPHTKETKLQIPEKIQAVQRRASEDLILQAGAALVAAGKSASVPNLAAHTGRAESFCCGVRRKLRLASRWPHPIEEKFKNTKYRA